VLELASPLGDEDLCGRKYQTVGRKCQIVGR